MNTVPGSSVAPFLFSSFVCIRVHSWMTPSRAPKAAGKTFYLMSRWVNPRLQAGPPSGVVSGTIAA